MQESNRAISTGTVLPPQCRVSTLLGLSVVVYVQDNMEWTVGFGVPVILMFIATSYSILCDA